jgi:hypothetical protein
MSGLPGGFGSLGVNNGMGFQRSLSIKNRHLPACSVTRIHRNEGFLPQRRRQEHFFQISGKYADGFGVGPFFEAPEEIGFQRRGHETLPRVPQGFENLLTSESPGFHQPPFQPIQGPFVLQSGFHSEESFSAAAKNGEDSVGRDPGYLFRIVEIVPIHRRIVFTGLFCRNFGRKDTFFGAHSSERSTQIHILVKILGQDIPGAG